MDNPEAEPTLPPYRILDLTEGGCMLGGRLLADLGADVITIEPPGGSPSRAGPFYKDITDPEKSLFCGPIVPIKGALLLILPKRRARNFSEIWYGG